MFGCASETVRVCVIEKERKKERFRVPVRGKCVRALGSRRREIYD